MDELATIVDHYSGTDERSRLAGGPSALELVRTREILLRHLPPAPARVLDVGGGPGAHAAWLAELGHAVHLVDPVPLHAEQAAELDGVSTEVGDARALTQPDRSQDVVLLLGPLYHLAERTDRVLALREAARVVRPGGLVAVAAISRYASTFDGFFRGYVDVPGFLPLMQDGLGTGQHRPPPDDPRFFTRAYFHDPAGLAAEIADAGLRPAALLPVEGMLYWVPDIAERLADPAGRELVLRTLAAMESDPGLTAASPHLLAVCTG